MLRTFVACSSSNRTFATVTSKTVPSGIIERSDGVMIQSMLMRASSTTSWHDGTSTTPLSITYSYIKDSIFIVYNFERNFDLFGISKTENEFSYVHQDMSLTDAEYNSRFFFSIFLSLRSTHTY